MQNFGNRKFWMHIVADLVRGGMEITMARDFFGIEKMPMQYYLNTRGIHRPAKTKRWTAEQEHAAFALLRRGATVREIYQLTGMTFTAIYEAASPTAKKRGRYRRPKRQV